MSTVKLAVIQFPRRVNEFKVNLAKAEEYVSRAGDADIVLLPEDWIGTWGIEWERYRDICLSLKKMLPSDTLLVAGAAFTRDGENLVSRGAFVYRDPPVAEIYEKLFPSYAVGERDYITPGTRMPVIEHKGIKMGALVCVDLFYPEITRRMALQGADIVFNPANIPQSRMKLWTQIGITRAAENTIYLAMSNNTNTGYADRRKVSGGSFIARPDGYEPQQCSEEPGVFSFDIELEVIKQTRRRWRYLEDIKTFI